MTEQRAEYNTADEGEWGDCLTCGKPFPVTKEGRRFCHPKCRMAYWRSLGKAVPAKVQSVTHCADGATVIVLRATATHKTHARALDPKQPCILMPDDSEAS
ncbi:hypothetical protein [Natronospira bacteriovora]|uniref:DNA gyrase inhibitor YacG n=1 Tax=Natronospira bacteriovora TaxID=3069753 RepID=A0ABU0W5I5_9GAMM|nr:hypothetical protein [Natronospira sp. AB-CW4]MDQ2069274.1 hypothetical protein [Natronospira sp. AB-CW4]